MNVGRGGGGVGTVVQIHIFFCKLRHTIIKIFNPILNIVLIMKMRRDKCHPGREKRVIYPFYQTM